jgi:hypothetical protein
VTSHPSYGGHNGTPGFTFTPGYHCLALSDLPVHSNPQCL